MSLCFLKPSSTAAEEATFTATVDSNQVALGDTFEVTFTLTGSTGGSSFRPPEFNDFDVLSGPNQSTSMQIINGSVSSSVSYSYTLQPRAEGKFTIGVAFIRSNDKKLQTRPITIEVVKGTAQPGRQAGRSRSQEDVRAQLSGNVLLKAEVDKTRVYQGEQITVSYKVYTRVQILNYNISKAPGLTGFWSEELQMPKEIKLSTETINGKQYAVGTLRKMALFPQRSGALNLDPMEIEVTVPVRRQSDDFFNSFFNTTQPVNYKTSTDAVAITVLPLPENAPAGFTGAVGRFQMDALLDKQEVKTNDAVTLKVKISGSGNLKLLEPPPISVPPDLERFDPKISNSIVPEGNRLAGSRTFEYLLIPRHAGDQKIPPFAFSYFDTDQQRFVTLRSPEFVIRVQRGAESEAPSVAAINREDVKLLGEDIRFIKSGDIGFRRRGQSFTGSALFYLLVLSPPFVFILFLVVLKQRQEALSDVFALRSRKARKIAQQRLAKAKKLLQQGKQEEFYSEVSRALWGYFADRFSIQVAELSRESVQSALQSRSVSADAISGIAATMDQCEFARFAPATDSQQMEKVYDDAVRLVSSIEDQLR